MASRLAVTDRDGSLRVLAVHETDQPADVFPVLDAGAVEAGPLPRLTWPVWLDGGRLAVTATTPNGRPGLYLVDPGRSPATLLYRPPPGIPIEIAPAVPFYANPSPDGRVVALATPGPQSLVLRLVDLDLSGGDPPEVAAGAPLFTAWSPRSDMLLVHAGAVINRLDRAAPDASTTIGLNAVDLRVPAWSPDGSLIATVRHGETRNAVVLIGRDGHHVARIGAVQGGAALAWSPAGEVLGVAPLRGGSAYSGIDLIDVRAAETRALTRDPLLLWLWSPTGDRIAYLRRAGAEGQLAWRIVHLDGRPPVNSGAFYPGPLFAIVIAFFDQYLLSNRLWSPDGRYLLAAGRVATNGPPADLWGGDILLFDTRGDRPLRALCRGEIGGWQA